MDRSMNVSGDYRRDSGALRADETYSLISADKVTGTPVYNLAGEKLGSVDRVMIDKRGGRVIYAVMSFGGFLGIGNKYHPLPWNVLTYDQDKGGYVVNLDRTVLEGASTFEDESDVDWGDRVWAGRLYDYYGVAPFWDDGLH